MSDFANLMTRTVAAANDLRTMQYTIQRQAGAGTCDIASHAAATLVLGPMGVLTNKPNSGQAATIAYAGETKVVAGGSVTVNVAVSTNSSGRATAAVSGDIIIGRALEAAGADGEVIRMLLQAPTPLLRE
tara:strand:+ start:2745 stop:3134 length:390 start_codon:yes stop_codon:yes gene_type:complete